MVVEPSEDREFFLSSWTIVEMSEALVHKPYIYVLRRRYQGCFDRIRFDPARDGYYLRLKEGVVHGVL